MKKLLLLILCVLTFSVAACAGCTDAEKTVSNNNPSVRTTVTDEDPVEQPEPEPEPEPEKPEKDCRRCRDPFKRHGFEILIILPEFKIFELGDDVGHPVPLPDNAN